MAEETGGPVTQDQVRKTKMAELRSRLDEIDGELLALSEEGTLDDAKEERWQDLIAERETVDPEYRKLEARAAQIDEIRRKTYREIHGMPEFKRPADEVLSRDIRSLSQREARDASLRALDDSEATYILSDSQKTKLAKQVRVDTDIARRIVVTENEHYRSAWHKLMTNPNAPALLTDSERVALQRAEEYRAQSEGSTTAGGFAIPVFIDPSVILTDQETSNPFLSLCRQVTVNTNTWKGVSAAGVTWSFDDEAEEVSDDAITIAQPSVTVHAARGFIPFSIEVGDDWPGFQAEMAGLLAAGYDELLVDNFTDGSGTGEPRGIITALDANTNVEVVSTTDGAFAVEDLYKVWEALPQKYRRNAAWMFDITIMNKIRQFGTADLFHASTINLPVGAIAELFGRPVYENPYFPDYSGTTGVSNRLVVGDWSNYVIARRSGMSVELVPHLFATGANRPSGSRGWFAHARIGGNSVNDLGFRLLQNQ
jgi:HK97 family phage major capsid protein